MASKAESSGEVNWHDVQGILKRGYINHKHSVFAVLKVTDKKKAGKWLAAIAQFVARGSDGSQLDKMGNACPITLSFSAPGLSALGLGKADLAQFSSEFLDGMAPPIQEGQKTTRRSGMLGDTRHNSPELWQWGGFEPRSKVKPSKQASALDVHVLLSIYGPSKEKVIEKFEQLTDAKSGVALSVDSSGADGYRSITHTYIPEDHREHFGFRDGISQPVFKGSPKESGMSEAGKLLHSVQVGEFLLGYNTERGEPNITPLTSKTEQNAGSKRVVIDLRKNGSYLVVRQLQQHVVEFDQMLATQARKFRDFETLKEGKNWIGARIMGRQFDGNPIVHSSKKFSNPPMPKDFFDHSNGEGKTINAETKYNNDFFFADDDSEGLTCPKTAHIRRANPRDVLIPDPRISNKIAKRHRILRRGRLYGSTPLRQSKGKGKGAKSNECGLFFLSFNADIAGQFETVQHSWINNRHSGAQYDEIDTASGQGEGDTRNHTIQQKPANIQLKNMADFVTVRGGGYFFMPGLEALKNIAQIAYGN